MRNFVGMFLLYICTVLALRPENNLEDLQESDAKAPPVPRCMLADDKKKERKKKNSFIMKKCRDAFQNEEKCLEQAVHGNCKWCEGLCGPSEV
mmetsp:Transcript_22881/g.49936  ORF Transcript_22881/g.49936 Transcript_22881/m.49936 type:complete len:93 (+) Transcript_22881:107-385(+)